ncbi:RNA-guided endonuclease IscB [Nocardiopsis sp. JB363]|uniref:RNA-guided endonuclease IscB n=1 Tax=Nocardiopsis sp. JB363 TaxID=1434837 RepID=UPI00097B86BB|nr:RNA-guided endonuclease IscB [Nocardiopsis sp. JB363]SIO86444.1 HNH endonuclease [Nocardiopsis sp. JB363]
MATFRTGQQTHPPVLPQQVALESESADKPRIGYETGLRHHPTVVPGADHVRGETTDISPDVGGVTTRPLAGERPRERHPSVFVLDKNQVPLQPCHPARARKLLSKGRAVVARHTPFTIRLKDRTIDTSVVDGVQVGIDPGSKHTGIAVFTHQAGERRGRYGIQLDHRGAQIRKKMGQRSAYRRGRRSRNLRHRAPRFANRSRPEGWLPPSLRHRVETTTAWVDRLTRWAPVRAVHVERVAFDTHVLSAGRPLEGVEYQRGALHGYEVREYLLAKFDRACVYCGVTDTPLNLDHVHPRSRGGSDRVSNLVLACVPCNRTKGDRPVGEFVTNTRLLARILARAKAPLRDAAAVQSTRWALWRALDQRLPAHVGSGGRTKWNRTRNHLPKTHTLDALAVGEVDTVTETIYTVLVAGCTGRGSYARTRPDKHGFPRLRLPRTKGFFGFTTGDLVRAVVPQGKKAGVHTGRVAVRASGSFNITTTQGTVQGIRYKHVRLLQRADGYGYTWKGEGVSSRP